MEFQGIWELLGEFGGSKLRDWGVGWVEGLWLGDLSEWVRDDLRVEGVGLTWRPMGLSNYL